jgi:biopolymer transport protein ExbB
MLRYRSSKFRIVLLIMILAAGIFAATGYAQGTGGAADAGGATAAPANNIFTLIFSHWVDPVFWTIAALSVTALTLMIQAFITNRASVMMPESTTQQIREMIEQRKFKDLLDFTETDPGFVSGALNAALKRASGGFAAMKEAMETAIGEQTAEQFRKIEYLNIIGNLGPLLGLLGTVLGMIEAFEAMHAAGGSAKPAELAHGISTALTHTFLGLFLAIPCLAAFGILRTIVDRLTVRGALVAEEMLLMLKPAEPRAVAQPGRPVAATPQPIAPSPAVPRRPTNVPAQSPLITG